MLTTDKVQVIYLDPIELKYYRLGPGLKKDRFDFDEKGWMKRDKFDFDGKGLIGYVNKTKTMNFSHKVKMDKKYNGLVDLETNLPLITHPFKDSDGKIIAIIQVEYNDIYSNTVDNNKTPEISPLDNEILEIYYGNVNSKLLQLFGEIETSNKLTNI